MKIRSTVNFNVIEVPDGDPQAQAWIEAGIFERVDEPKPETPKVVKPRPPKS